jgi:uncharacterized protein (TIGR00369 family)
MTVTSTPNGFKPHFRQSKFTDPWEPLYSQVTDEQVSIGVRLAEAHCNSRGLVHGGLIASLADNAMGLSCVQKLRAEGREVSGLVTVTLNTDYIGSAKLGEWFETDTHFIKTGGTLCFTDSLVRANGEPIARASASFKIIQPKQKDSK